MNDNDPIGGVSEITVPDNFNVLVVRVQMVQLRHDWCGDVEILLEKDGGPTAVLVSRIGRVGGSGFGDSSNLNGTYTIDSESMNNIWIAAATLPTAGIIPSGTYQPSGAGSGDNNFSLDQFIGLSAGGIWRLRVRDLQPDWTGFYGSWNLLITDGPACNPCADANCDGFVTVADIGAFVTALTQGEAAWESLFGPSGPCDYLCSNDTNNDGFVTVADIGTFVGALTGSPCSN